jgi:hypothetical protein
MTAGTHCRRHPPPGRRHAPPDDRLQRMIQYSATFMLTHRRSAILGRPVKPGDDGWAADSAS